MALTKIKKNQFAIKGQKNVIKNLNRAVRKIKDNTGSGIHAAIEFVKGESQEMAPVDQGTLMNSAFAKMGKLRGAINKIIGVAGFTAEYSAAVHEMKEVNRGKKRTSKGSKGYYWDGGENKFLEKAVVRNIPTILNLIKRFAGRKPV